MLNKNASYVHSTYFLKGVTVSHIEKIGDLVITSGKICACDPCFLTDNNKNQEIDLAVPVGIYPVLVDSKEHLVNVMFNPRGDILFWDELIFKRKKYQSSVEVDTGHYGFIDKIGVETIEQNIKNGVYSHGFSIDEAQQSKQMVSGYDSCEINVTNSRNNFLCTSTRLGNDEYGLYAGYNKSNRIDCISGCLLGKSLKGKIIRSLLSLYNITCRFL